MAMSGIVTVSRLIPFMTEKMLKRLDTLPFIPQSAIIMAFPLYTGAADGNIAQFARVPDYHETVYKLLQNEKITVKGNLLPVKNGWPLPLVPAANMCGVGFTGRHGLQIVEPYGSFAALGAILCDTLLEETRPEGGCAGCGECERACPTGAMRWDGEKRILDRERCLACITQTKDAPNLGLLKDAAYIWGCDLCQNVCPHNVRAEKTRIPEFTGDVIANVDINMLNGDLTGRHYSNRLGLLRRNLEYLL